MQRRRTTTACARCHHRKRKCDKKFPRCSSCREAGVECKGLSRDANIDAPRSVVQYLEHAISQVEAQIASTGAYPAPTSDFNHSPHSPRAPRPWGHDADTFHSSPLPHHPRGKAKILDENSFKVASATAFTSGIGTPASVLADLDGIPYKDALLLDTELPLPLAVNQIKSNPLPHHLHGSDKSIQHRPEPLIPPVDMAKTLFEIFVQNILPQNPCFFEDEIRDHFNAVYFHPGTPPPDVSVFMISTVLAISTMTSKAYDQKKILSLGESLHHQALRHSKFLSLPSIQSLQGILLLLQLAELLPYTGNLWHLAGEAVSLTTELGLHQDPHGSEGFDFKSLDLRRRVFWTTYCLERSTTVTSYRPFTLRDEHINVAFPSEYDDASIKPEGIIPGGRRSKIQFLNYVRFRQIQSEILSVQFFNADLHGQEYPQWQIAMEKRLVDWQQAALAAVEKGPDWFTHALWQCYLMLHRPCPRNKVPTEHSIVTCFEAALGLSSGSWELLKTGYLQYPFHNAHNGFEAATVVLYGLRYHTMRIRDQYGSRKVIDLIHQLSGLFMFLSPRWPAAAAISDFYNNLKKTTIKEFMMASTWTPSPQNFFSGINMHPLDLIVLHKAVATLNHPEPRAIMATEAYDESDIVLSNLLGDDQQFNNQLIPAVTSPWDNFWDIGGPGFEPGITNWLQTSAPAPFLERAPLPLPVPVPVPVSVDSYIEMPMQEGNPMPSSPAPIEINFEALKNTAHLLPACNRCRTRRIKCERMTLECQQCKSAESACVYFDQLLSKNIACRYVDALQKRLLGLLESQNRISLPADLLPPSPIHQTIPESEDCMGVHSRPTVTSASHFSGHGETHDPMHQSTIFFGVTSAISQLADLKCCTTLSERDFRLSPKTIDSSLKSLQRLTVQHRPTLPPQATTMALLSVFNNSLNVVCHVISIEALHEIVAHIYGGSEVTDIYELQTLHLVLAISLQLLSKRDHSLSNTAQAYFKEVASDSGRISSLLQRDSLKSLRIAILLCVFVMIRPSSGDIWRLVGFASRLCLGMISTPRNNNTDKETFELLYQTLLCIDCHVSTAFGRPSQLPDYHDTLTTPPPQSQPLTFTEQLSSYYQNMRRIESAMHDAVVRNYVNRGDRLRRITAVFHTCGEQLESWRLGWNVLFEPMLQPNTGIVPGLISDPSRLKQWGDLAYYKTLLLLQRLSPSATISAPGRLQSLHHFFQAYRDIYYDFQTAASSFLADPSATFTAYLYPGMWMCAQSVLSAALDLVGLKEQFSSGSHEPVFRSCITLLSLLEGDSNNMLDGLTQIVERLYDSLSGVEMAREASLQSA